MDYQTRAYTGGGAGAGAVPGAWLTRWQAAEVLRCSMATLERRLKSAGIVSIKEGSRVLVSRASLDAYLERCRQAHADRLARLCKAEDKAKGKTKGGR